jgi:hypothetical protein
LTKATPALFGDGRTFSRGRDLSAWLGLVPRQASTGGKAKLPGITKRGSKYLRKLIIQGARAALPSLSRTATPLGSWLRGLLSRAHGNTVVVALAMRARSFADLVNMAVSLRLTGGDLDLAGACAPNQSTGNTLVLPALRNLGIRSTDQSAKALLDS